MKWPTLKSWLVLIVLIPIILIITLITRTYHTNESLLNTGTTTKTNSAPSRPTLTKIRIPRIDLETTIESLGLTPDGIMDAPKSATTTAWYKLGVYPGEIGSAVMDGHSGWKNGEHAVFDNLNQLKIGDKIYISNANSETVTFVVKKIETFDKNANTNEIFNSNDSKSHLNLITCSGIWDSVNKNSSTRLVVFTDRE